MTELLRTPLHDLHVALGAKLVGFAGYEMPVHYPMGVLREHLHCRAAAGLFDVSHMGQVKVRGQLESLVPVDIAGLAEGRQRYGFFTNDAGGILDDLMLANRGDHIFVVVNAACKKADIAHMRTHLDHVEELTDRALLALQGPAAEDALAVLCPAVRAMRFMDVASLDLDGVEAWISRSGYTGEDGFEISVPADAAIPLARRLLADSRVAPIGLGARDSLRLEAGLCLYGHDIDTTTTPVEAGLQWAIQKTRRQNGGFPGADVILAQLADGPSRRRVGLLPEGRAPMREGVQIYETATGGAPIGNITSGGFGPTVERPIAMAYLDSAYASPGTTVYGDLRGKRLPVQVSALPFTPANFKR